MLQYLGDGLVLGSAIGLGAVGLTLVYAILRFADFAHGDFITLGAYMALTLLWAMMPLTGLPVERAAGRLPPLGFGLPLIAVTLGAAVITAGFALLLDRLLFARLRRHGVSITAVIASFGAALAVRYLLVVVYGPQPDYFSRSIQIAVPIIPRDIWGGLRLPPDQLVVIGCTAVTALGLHLLLTRTATGRAMRAVAENPGLAAVAGIDTGRVVRHVWVIGAMLAALSGVLQGQTVQIRPHMGFELLLPLFAAAILGGIGSPLGALAGGLLVGLTESLAVPLIGAEYRAGVAFLVLIAVLLVRPQGLAGNKGRT